MNKLVDEASKETGGLMGKVAVGMLFGNSRIGPWLQKKVTEGILKAEEIKAFENQVRKEYERIPEPNRIEPNPRLVVQAITAAEPILIEGDSAEELRRMFARLIAAGCDVNKADFVHPSFSSVLGEMSPIDAQILFLFKNTTVLPVVNYKFELEKGFIDFETTVFLYAPEGVSTEIATISLQCLAHLGLLEISYESKLARETLYEKYEAYPPYIEQKQIISNPDYQRILKDFPSINDYKANQRAEKWQLLKTQDEYVRTSNDKIQTNILLGARDVILKKGLVGLTAFGNSFLKCCGVDDSELIET